MQNKPETAIIIRARNEERWIGEVLTRLAKQTYQNFEIIVVDSGSIDRTLEVTEKYPAKVVTIRPEEFTYPYAINVGIEHSIATKYLVMLSAHSLPIDETWLESGIQKFGLRKNILGIYGPLLALPGATIWDILFHGISYIWTRLRMFPKKYRVITNGGGGVLGFTNAIIRRDLWEQHPINEAYAGGGEDGNWAEYWFSRGYVAIKDAGFTVRHSHYLSFNGWKAQFAYWRDNAQPQPFKRLTYRKDGSHDPV